MSERDLARLEHQLGRLLAAGVWITAATLLVGLILQLSGRPVAARVLAGGLMLLMAIPLVRIGASFVDAVRRRDQMLAWATAIVLLVMAITIVYSLRTP